jgi:peptide deformylase
MAILKIARMGHPVLGRPAAAVEDPRDPALRQLADDMIATMRDAEGTGLAAPQVHQSKRLLVFFVDAGRARAHAHGGGPDDEVQGEGAPLTVLVNPDYEALSEEKDEAWEACLSIPGLAGRVPRYRHIRYWGTDLDGNAIEREATGFHARVVQHECDHLDGVLFPQRMTDMSTLIFTSEMDRYAEGEARTAASRPRAAS